MYDVVKFDKEKIRGARIGKSWTRGKVATLADVHESTVYRLEKLGQGHIENVGRIIDVLGLEMKDVELSTPKEPEPASRRRA